MNNQQIQFKQLRQMKTKLAFFILQASVGFILNAQSEKLTQSIIDENIVFEEEAGLVSVEAEFFYKQTNISSLICIN